jgi:hypothetical protein
LLRRIFGPRRHEVTEGWRRLLLTCILHKVLDCEVKEDGRDMEYSMILVKRNKSKAIPVTGRGGL